MAAARANGWELSVEPAPGGVLATLDFPAANEGEIRPSDPFSGARRS
jgi:hypothetical protein